MAEYRHRETAGRETEPVRRQTDAGRVPPQNPWTGEAYNPHAYRSQAYHTQTGRAAGWSNVPAQARQGLAPQNTAAPAVRRAPGSALTEQEASRRALERAARKRKKRKRRKLIPWWLKLPLYIIFVAAVSGVLAEYGWRLAQDLCAFDETNPVPMKVSVTVSANDDLESVSQKLYDAGLIQYRWFFELFARFARAENKIGAGTYELNTDMDYRALITGMRSSSGTMSAEVIRLTIPEGYTVNDIITLLAKNGVATREELEDAAKNTAFDYDFINNDSHELTRLEGYLFPDTYDFFQPENPVSALSKFLNNFQRKRQNWTEALEYAKNRGYTLDKIVIIASLIEKETDGTDQARIASVIYNRLDGSGDRGGTYGLLQIDAALLYALPDHTGAITTADLEVDSPYNLYRRAGLPPTAIANPGAASIEAALSPESTDYFYYGLAKDGRHRFFSNYREFTAFLDSRDYIGN